MSQVSQISVSSNINAHQNKLSPSSKFDQSTEGGQTSRGTFESNSSASKKSILNHQIHKLQLAEIEMQRKFQKCVQSLIKQIQQKQALTNRLMKQINDMKEHIQESKKDIQTISSYVKKNVKNVGQTESRLMTKTSQKNMEVLGSYKSLKKIADEKSNNKTSMKVAGGK